MNKGDLYIYGPMFAMFAWSIIAPTIFPTMPGNTVAIVSAMIMVGPMLFMDIWITRITSSCSYVRAVVRPHGDILRFYIKDYEEFRGEVYNTIRIKVNWDIKTRYHGKVSELKITYEGKWNDRVLWSRGTALLWEFEVEHRAIENLILYEVMEDTHDYYRTQEIPHYHLGNASGDYYDEIGLIEYNVLKETTKEEEKPGEEERQEEETVVE